MGEGRDLGKRGKEQLPKGESPVVGSPLNRRENDSKRKAMGKESVRSGSWLSATGGLLHGGGRFTIPIGWIVWI